ncbi:MAG TPA: SDR family oxidoreductase [Gemmatimonadaceae bacterium]|jgi:NADP-dependent 3-hydroxy acid dehydrogenase YdfG|nr:SDR family oxidoreductase [Gemmatimonadaceae bacterium]
MNNSDVVVITGASGGIGAAIAKRLGRDKERLVLAARRKAELHSIAEEAKKLGAPTVLEVPTDVTNRDDVNHLRDAAIAEFGRIDVWINNAGRGISKRTLDLTEEDVDDMIKVNLKSALYGMQAVIPHFIERGRGHVINISSFLARVPVASHRSVYSASKAALNSLTANVRMDLLAKHPDVHVSLIMPGVVHTDFAVNANTPDELRIDLPGRQGAAPTQTADEVADYVAGVMENPIAESYTNPASQDLARGYYSDVGAFEARVVQHFR